MGEHVVLIHGIGSCSLLLRPFAGYLRRESFRTTLWGYRTLGNSVLDDARKLRAFLQPLAERDEPTHFVTHSMGGIVLRAVINDIAWRVPGRLVMLAPPNHGSMVARFAAKFVNWASPALADISDAPHSLVHQLPEPSQFQTGVIAGSRDMLVAIRSTKLACQRDHIVLHCGHNRLMFHRAAMGEAACFLRTGNFSRKTLRLADLPMRGVN